MSIADLNTANLDLKVNSLTLNNQQSNKILSVYKEYTIAYTSSGPYPTPLNGVASVTIMDNRVSISFPGASSSTTVTTSTITLNPVEPFPQPIRNTIFPVVIFSTNVSNNVNVIGWGIIFTSGVIEINTVAPATYFSTSGYQPFCLTYNLN